MRAESPATFAIVIGPDRFRVETRPVTIFFIRSSVIIVFDAVSCRLIGIAANGPYLTSRINGATPT